MSVLLVLCLVGGFQAAQPNLALWSDVTRESIPVGIFYNPPSITDHPFLTLRLAPAVGDSPRSVVYPIAVYRNKWVIKYTMFCPSDELDPISHEAKFLRIVNNEAPSVGNKFLFVSEGVPMPDTPGKIPGARIVCDEDITPMMKYIITERVGMTLHEYGVTEGNLSVWEVATIGLQLMRVVKRLHDIGIVHGDIHTSNIAWRGKDRYNLVLIDFGRANYPEAIVEEEVDVFDPKWVACHPYLSLWESAGSSASYRDDVFRVMVTLAVLLYGPWYTVHLGEMCKDEFDQYFELKRDGNLFDTEMIIPSDEVGWIKYSYKFADQAKLQNLFAALMLAVRYPNTRLDKPDYALIEYLLEQLISVSAPAL